MSAEINFKTSKMLLGSGGKSYIEFMKFISETYTFPYTVRFIWDTWEDGSLRDDVDVTEYVRSVPNAYAKHIIWDKIIPYTMKMLNEEENESEP